MQPCGAEGYVLRCGELLAAGPGGRSSSDAEASGEDGCAPKLQDRQAVARAMRALMLLRSSAHRQKQDRGTQP